MLYDMFPQARPGVDQQIAVLHELNTALTMVSGHPSQNRVGGVIQALVPLLAGVNNEVRLACFGAPTYSIRCGACCIGLFSSLPRAMLTASIFQLALTFVCALFMEDVS